MQLRTLLMILQYYVLYSDILKWWEAVVLKSDKFPCLSLQHVTVFHHGSFQQLRSRALRLACTMVSLALALPMCQRMLQRRAVWTRDQEWNLWHCPAATGVIQWYHTPRSTTKIHPSHVWTHKSAPTVGEFPAHQSHSRVRGTGWDNSHTVHKKKGYLRDMYTLIKLVTSGTDWHPSALCPTQTHFVKLSWHSIAEVCRSPIQHNNFLLNLHLSSVSQYIMNWYNGTTGG